MGEANRATVRMQFGDGTVISSWLSFSLRDNYLDPLGTLEFVAAPPRDQIARYRRMLVRGELVTVLANDVNQGTFIITTVRRDVGEDGVVFHVTCRSPLVTPQEGSVNPELSFSSDEDAPLGQIILQALLPYGFEQLSADASANVSALTGRPLSGGTASAVNQDTLKTQEAQAQEAEKAYQFCARLLSRRAVALRMAVDGTLLLGTPNYDQEIAYTVVQDFDGATDGDRFMGTISVTETNDGQYSECRVRGNAYDRRGRTHSAQPFAVVTAEDVNPSRPAYQSVAAAYKRLEILDKDARDDAQCRSVAKLALGYAARNAFQVVGEVDGLISLTGRFWQVDTLARVVIRADELDETMWLLERVLIQDKEGGQRTRLTFVPKGAVVLGELPQ